MAGYNDPGGANNVQGGSAGYEDDAEGLAGAYQQIVGRNKKAQGPNAAAYNKQTDAAQDNANGYSDRARNFTQDAAKIDNQYQGEDRSAVQGNVGSENYLADHLRDVMEGKDVTGAQNQIQQGTDAGIAAQLSLARSAKGGGAAQAGAYRSAQQQGAVQQAGVASAAGLLQAKMASDAAGQQANVYGNIGSQLGSMYGLEQGSAIQQAQLDATNQGQIDQTRLGYGALGNNAQSGSLAALNGYTNGNLSAQGLQPGIDAENGGGKIVGTAASVAGAALMSDERVKSGIANEGKGGSRVDAFLDGIHPLSYHYKSADLEPRTNPTGGRYLGISAQDLEAVPEVGHQLVSDGPRGKQVEVGPSLSAALAGIARLHERVKGLETTSATRKATPGAIEEDNINHYGRGEIDNGDGTRSTVRSMSFNDGPGREVLIPTAYDGAVHSDDEAIAHYRQTGQHMGIYKTPEAATAHAKRVHDDYENGRYADVGSLVMEQRERRPTVTSDMAAKTDVASEGNVHTPRTVAPGTPGMTLDRHHKAGEAPPSFDASDTGTPWLTTSGPTEQMRQRHLAAGRAMDAARAGEADRLEAVRQHAWDRKGVQQVGTPIAHVPAPTGDFDTQVRDQFGSPPSLAERLMSSASNGAARGGAGTDYNKQIRDQFGGPPREGQPTLASLYTGGR